MSKPEIKPPAAAEPLAPDTNVQLELRITATPSRPTDPAASPKQSPWLTPVTAPLLVALLASVAPVTAAVYAHYQAALQLALDRQTQADVRTQLYLERAISPDAGAESRLQVLRFLALQSVDTDLHAWASVELAELGPEVTELKATEKELVTTVARADQALTDLSVEQEALVAQLSAKPDAEQPILTAKLAEINTSLTDKRALKAENSARLSQVSTRLYGSETAVVPQANLCAHSAYFNPVARVDFALSLADRQARARECDRSLSARVPPADATVSASGQQWRWQLPSGITCGCQLGH